MSEGHGHGMSGNATTTASPAKVSQTAAQAASAAAKAARKANAFRYSYEVWWLETGIIGFATLINVLSVYWAWRRRRALRRAGVSGPQNQQAGTSTGTVSWLRLPAAVLTASRIAAFRWRIPHIDMTVLELLFTLAYMAALFVWDFTRSQGMDLHSIQLHAALLAIAQFPLIVALAMKNNAIQFLTGISHEKLNLMHRVVARVVLIQIWIHWWAIVADKTKIFSVTWRWMGLIAGVSFTILTALSIKPIRKRFYEFFWITHVIFVMLFLIAAVWHCVGAGSVYGNYMWPCFIIWGQDRLCRYIRYLLLTSFQSPNKAPARIELLSDDTMRITVRRSFLLPLFLGRGFFEKGAGWKAGQHMFLAFPTIGPLESHPFTIASVCEPLDGPATKEGTELAVDNVQDSKERELMWVVRARSGFTRRLREQVLNKDGVANIPVFMDGPYGAPPDLSGFDTCVFVAGGSGVAFTIPRMRDLLNNAAKRDACAKRIVFIWAIRHAAHINWIARDLQKAVATCPADVELSILIYVTSRPALSEKPTFSSPPTLSCMPTLANDSTAPSLSESPISPLSPSPTVTDIATEHRAPRAYASSSDADLEKASDSTHTAGAELEIRGVEVRAGRPDMHALLKDIVTGATGTVSVDISGPTALVAATRSALSSDWAGPMAVLRGGASVQLNVEDFTM
ncbi:NADPH oxidase family protein [Phanerochaete sordida]|uniref:NADPH oxidase family protein n=1 Tax=Phanerochaete sordida TaxID=48140 RepID=A0A9P3LCP6_9APHY|nr:NADPH oxidase family protein [Phanerochaete sordida]